MMRDFVGDTSSVVAGRNWATLEAWSMKRGTAAVGEYFASFLDSAEPQS